MLCNKKLRLGILLMLFSSICACLGQLLWKFFAQNESIGFLVFGFVLYGVGALLMIIAYRFGPLSVLQPVLSFNYILTILLAFFVLNEKITIFKCIGVLFVVLGIVLIATGESDVD